MSIVYEINKGINRSIELKGLKAQYIVYFLVGIVGLLVLYAAAYIAGVPTLVCLAIVGVLASILYTQVYKYSNKYGQYGLMKEAAFRQVPSAIRCRNRKMFFELKGKKEKQHDSGTDPDQHAADRTAANTKG